jgi:hypothetical protein
VELKSLKKNKYPKLMKSGRLEMRINPILKEALKKYCDEHIESSTEAVTNAIKKYIGFDKRND